MLSSNKKDIFILLIISIFAFLSVIWVKEVDIMEARNFISAREILDSSDWWTTTLNGQLRFEKPPFPTWLTALTMLITHSKSEFILRIPNTLISILTVIFLYISTLRIKKDRVFAFLCSFILITCFMFIKIGAENTWDIYNYTFAFLASLFNIYNIYYFLFFYFFKRKKKRKNKIYYFSHNCCFYFFFNMGYINVF